MGDSGSGTCSGSQRGHRWKGRGIRGVEVPRVAVDLSELSVAGRIQVGTHLRGVRMGGHPGEMSLPGSFADR
jgi:hypothetical protein